MRKLDLLVPIYDEGRDVLRTLLDSVAVQQGVDLSNVGVIVGCDGGSTELTGEFLEGYPFEVEFHRFPHRGVSATRNACMDLSEAEYVMFCDCDDMFCDASGLFVLFREMERGFDAFVSAFREQTKGPDGSMTFIARDARDRTFVHGKCFRRAFLADNAIRWGDRLEIHEDSFFVTLATEVAGPRRTTVCPHPFYLWRWRDQSVCRHDPKYILKTYGCLIDSNDALVDELTRRMMAESASRHVAAMTFDAYYLMNKAEWREQENRKYRDAVERRFAEYFAKHESKWESMTERERVAISNVVRQRSVRGGMLMEALTIGQWLDRIRDTSS